MNVKEELKFLYQSSFSDSEKYVDFFFENVYDEKNVVFVREKGKIVSALHSRPCSVSLGNRSLSCGVIFAAATLPEFRKMGYFRTVMHTALRKMRDEGFVLSMLYPFSHEYYRQFGFETLTFAKRISAKEGGQPFVLRKISEKDTQLLHELYCSVQKEYDLSCIRSVEQMKNVANELLCDGGEGYLILEGDKALGYALLDAGEFCELCFPRNRDVQKLPQFILKNALVPIDFPCEGTMEEHMMFRVVNAKELAQAVALDKSDSWNILDPILGDVVIPSGKNSLPKTCSEVEFLRISLGFVESVKKSKKKTPYNFNTAW